MKSITVSQTIDAPRDRTFEVFTDLFQAADRISGITQIEVLTDGPIGQGTRWRETRIMFKREATEEMEISEFQPHDRYVVTAESCGAAYRTEFRFLDEGSGTRVEMEFGAKPLNFIAKLMTPLSYLMAGSVKKCLQQDIDDLKRFLESPQVQTA